VVRGSAYSAVPLIFRKRLTFRGLEKPSGMRGQVVLGFAGGTAGRHCRHLPFAYGKAATHRASKPSALEGCRVALVQCHIPEPGRTLLSKQFCSFVAPTCSFAPPRYDLRSACIGAIWRAAPAGDRHPAYSWRMTAHHGLRQARQACHAANASGFTSRLASWVSMASARRSSSRLKCNIFCSSRRSNWPASAAAVPYAAIS
jgi:hypothetical protein